jgi:hypothetical protein
MNYFNLDKTSFHLTLNEIAADAKISFNETNFTIGEQVETTLTAEQMTHVLEFIRKHACYLESKDSEVLKRLHARLSLEIPEHIKQDIDSLFQELYSYDASKADAISPKCLDHESLLLTTLTQALDDPSLTLTKELSFVFGKPQGWQSSAVIEALQQAKRNLDITQIQLAEVIDRLIQEHQPPRLVKLGLCIEESETGDGNLGVVLRSLDAWLQNGLPILTTKALLCGCRKLRRGEIYSQKEGGLAICVPANHNIEELGINLEEFQKIPGGVQHLEFEEFDPQNDLQKALVQPDKGAGIHRLIVSIGHGDPVAAGEARICGLQANKFQEMLQALSENGLAFLIIYSCFSGGENATQICLPDGTIPCPILLTNATESIALVDPRYVHLAMQSLDAAGSKLYAQLPSGRTPRLPHTLRLADFQEVGKLAIGASSNDLAQRHSLQTILLPSKRPDIPRVTYTGETPVKVLNLDEAIRKQQRKDLYASQKRVQIDVDARQVNTLFCSAPRLPAIIEMKEGNKEFGILARGGNSIHFIDELKILETSLEEFILASANKIHRFAEGTPARLIGANKLFMIDKLQCKNSLGKPSEIYNIVISLGVTEAWLSYSDSEGRCYRHEISLNLYPKYSSSPAGSVKSALKLSPQKEIEVSEYIFNCFDQCFCCHPTDKHLFATTAGQVAFNDLCDELAGKIEKLNPAYVELCKMALQPHFVDHLIDKLEAIPKEPRRSAADHALRLAIAADNEVTVTHLLKIFGPLTAPLIDDKSALHLAAEKGAIAVIKRLLKESIEIDLPDHLGRTPLHYAVIEHHYEIIEILLEKCSDLALDKHKRSPLDYAMLNHRDVIFQKMLQRRTDPIVIASSLLLILEAACNPSNMQAIIESKRVSMKGFEERSFLEHFIRKARTSLRYSQVAKSLELLIDAGCAEAELADEDGHHLLMRFLLEEKYFHYCFNDKILKILSDVFPLSEQDKIQLSEKWHKKLQVITQWSWEREPILNTMKALNIATHTTKS